jgi:hypothetical protein
MNEPWHNPGKWYVSPYNFAEEAIAKFNFPPGRQVVIRDPSFSDEPQGVRYTRQDKIDIARRFDDAGVGEIFHHIHGVTEEKLDCITALCGLGLRAKVGAYLRVPSEPRWKEYMDRLIDGGIDEIQLHENTRARLDFAVPGKHDVLSTEQMVLSRSVYRTPCGSSESEGSAKVTSRPGAKLNLATASSAKL